MIATLTNKEDIEHIKEMLKERMITTEVEFFDEEDNKYVVSSITFNVWKEIGKGTWEKVQGGLKLIEEGKLFPRGLLTNEKR